MSPHVDILDQRDPIRKALLGSVALHVSVAALVAFWGVIGLRHRESWGSPTPGGGAVGINIVKGIPLPARSGQINPVANDTQSFVPEPPPKTRAQKKAPPPEPDAIPIQSRNAPKRPSRVASSENNRFRAQQQDRPNQMYSSNGQAAVSPMFGQTGGGGIGVGPGGPFGNRFGYYVDLLRQKVGEKWRTGDVDPRIQTAPPVVVTFTIMRDGSVREVRIAQRSGIYALDLSAQRAIMDAQPLPPLPNGYERDSATIEFWFQLRR